MIDKKELKRSAKKILMAQGITKWCVLYLANNHERRTPWFYSIDRCRAAQKILVEKHGYKTCLYMD